MMQSLMPDCGAGHSFVTYCLAYFLKSLDQNLAAYTSKGRCRVKYIPQIRRLAGPAASDRTACPITMPLAMLRVGISTN